jgi:hypothetical protein
MGVVGCKGRLVLACVGSQGDLVAPCCTLLHLVADAVLACCMLTPDTRYGQGGGGGETEREGGREGGRCSHETRQVCKHEDGCIHTTKLGFRVQGSGFRIEGLGFRV